MLIIVNMNCLLLIFLLPLNVFNGVMGKEFKATWEDLDTRPLPRWYDEAKIGIFLHWGIYSVPSFGSEFFWRDWILRKKPDYKKFMAKNYPAGFIYEDFAPMFTAEFFDPKEWAALFQQAGAKYVVLTSKHHDGFTLFPAPQYNKWSSATTGPKRDLVGELSKSVRKVGLKFGVYYSLIEWFNPNYVKDKISNFKSRTYPRGTLVRNIKQLVNNYKPSVFWADGNLQAPASYWNSTEMLAWLYNDSPVKNIIVTNDRWGEGCKGKHGDFYKYKNNYNPGKLLPHKWENAFSLDYKSWGYRRHVPLRDIMSFDQLLYQVVTTVSYGGNVLINVGPTKEGTTSPIFQERLLSLGKWLSVNGEAIYESSPWYYQKDSSNGHVWYTCRRHHVELHPDSPGTVDNVFATILKWPKYSRLTVADVTSLLIDNNLTINIYMLGYEYREAVLEWQVSKGKTVIFLPNQAAINSSNAWTLKIALR